MGPTREQVLERIIRRRILAERGGDDLNAPAVTQELALDEAQASMELENEAQ